jgi:zinc transporter ZupT
MITDLALLFITPIVGSLMVLTMSGIKKQLNLLLTFSGAYLLSLVFLHIIPDLFHSGAENIGLFILLGFFIQVLLDYLSKGLEHGHAHVSGTSALGGVLFGLYFHAFLEGIPIGFGDMDHLNENHSFLIGVILHKLPISIVLTSLLLTRYQSKRKAFLQIIVFALIGPLGYMYGFYFGGNSFLSSEHIMAIVVGIFIHVGTTIIFESSDTHKINFQKLIAIIAGFMLSVILIAL